MVSEDGSDARDRTPEAEKRDHVWHTVNGHEARSDRAAAIALEGLPVPIASRGPAGQARLGDPWTAEDNFRAWLFLTSAWRSWMQNRSSPQIESRILVAQA